MTHPSVLALARKCAEQSLLDGIAQLIGQPDKIARRKAMVARIRSGEGDARPEVKAAIAAIEQSTTLAAKHVGVLSEHEARPLRDFAHLRAGG